MKHLFPAISLCFFISLCRAQADTNTFRLVSVMGRNIVDFTIDNLGNIYTLDVDNQLKKTGPAGDSLGVFNDVRKYGKVFSIDATNPLKVLLYYKDFGTIVVLDRFLNIRNTISLSKQNIFQVRAIGQSFDNGIWIYDEQEAKLKRLSEDGNIIAQSSDFRLFMDAAPSPVQLVDQDRLVYLYDPQKGLFVFDYFGSLKNKVALLGWDDFQVVGGKAFGRKKTVIEQYQPGTLSLKEQTLTAILSGVIKIKIAISNLYCLKEGAVNVYTF